eukprot:1216227-Amphidinium_carterae.1
MAKLYLLNRLGTHGSLTLIVHVQEHVQRCSARKVSCQSHLLPGFWVPNSIIHDLKQDLTRIRNS